MSRSSAAAVPSWVIVIGFDDWLATGLQSLLKLNFHSCSFRMASNLISKTDLGMRTVGVFLGSASMGIAYTVTNIQTTNLC